MQQPEHLRSFQATNSTPRRIVALGATIAVQAALIYALASGLASHLVDKLPSELKAEVVKETIPVKPPPPPPPPQLDKVPPPSVPPPEFQIQNEAPVTNTITVTHNVQPPIKAPGITAPALISGGAKCQSSYYPPIATRLNQEGTTTVSVHVAADGSVTGVEVTNSSGHDSLDQAALRCIQREWHFKPAMQNGVPVQTTKQYAIKWQLQG